MLTNHHDSLFFTVVNKPMVNKAPFHLFQPYCPLRFNNVGLTKVLGNPNTQWLWRIQICCETYCGFKLLEGIFMHPFPSTRKQWMWKIIMGIVHKITNNLAGILTYIPRGHKRSMSLYLLAYSVRPVAVYFSTWWICLLSRPSSLTQSP